MGGDDDDDDGNGEDNYVIMGGKRSVLIYNGKWWEEKLSKKLICIYIYMCVCVLPGGGSITWFDRVKTKIKNFINKAIAPYIPVKDPQLSSTLYEIVLAWFLKSDHKVK